MQILLITWLPGLSWNTRLVLATTSSLLSPAEVTSSSLLIQGLFALASMPSHSCVANATHYFSTRESGYRMTMRAVVRIKKGAEITHSYTEPLDPVLLRRTLLQVSSLTQLRVT